MDSEAVKSSSAADTLASPESAPAQSPSSATATDWKAKARLRYSPTGVLIVEYEGMEPQHPAQKQYEQEGSGYNGMSPLHFPYTAEAMQSHFCGACNRGFASANAVLQHLRDHAAHRDGPEAQEAAYVLQCQEQGLIPSESATSSPTAGPDASWGGWPQQQQQQQQWWWSGGYDPAAAAAAAAAQGANHAGSSPSDMSCNEQVELEDDNGNHQQQHNGARQQHQQHQGGFAKSGPRRNNNNNAGSNGRQGKGGAPGQQRQGGQQAKRAFLPPPPPAVDSHGYDSAFPALGGAAAAAAVTAAAAAPVVSPVAATGSWQAKLVVQPDQPQQPQQQSEQQQQHQQQQVEGVASDKEAAPSSPAAGLRVSAPAFTPAC